MRLSDTLIDLGAPVAYYPQLAKVLGGVKATIFLCQLMYWLGKQANANGWIYKTVEEIETETGLNYREQQGAREHLKRRGLLKEHYQRVEHRLYFRPDLPALDSLWEKHKKARLRLVAK